MYKIVVFNPKGGVGKTSLSFSLALSMGLKYVSNDDSVVFQILDNAEFTDKKVDSDEPLIYDLGGFVTTNTLDIINDSNLVIIPLTSNINSILQTNNLLSSLEHNNVLIVFNAIEDLKQIDFINDNLTEHEHLVLTLKRSKLIDNAMLSGKSIEDTVNENNLTKHNYKSAYVEYVNFVNIVKKLSKKGK